MAIQTSAHFRNVIPIKRREQCVDYSEAETCDLKFRDFHIALAARFRKGIFVLAQGSVL